MDNYIKVYNLFGPTLDSREAATLLFERSEIYSSLNIDFAGVNFMSRSFADQLMKDINIAKQKGTQVDLQNLNESLVAILTAVERTQKGHRKDWSYIPIISFYDKRDLYKHLESI